MGFDVIGPTRRTTACNIDDGRPPFYDILSLPDQLNLPCPQLRRLNDRFYESTTVSCEDGSVAALRDELALLRVHYRRRREPELARERGVRACNPQIRHGIIARLWESDLIDRILADLLLICEDAISHRQDIRCAGD